MKTEVLGSGLSILAATYLFYAIDPYTRGKILIEKVLKLAVYCLIILGFNLALRVRHRTKRLDPDSRDAWKAHIKLTAFFLFMFGVMDLAITLESI